MSTEISVRELKAKREAGETLVLLDVREPDELAVVSLPWAKAIPMGEVPTRLAELPAAGEIVVMCHHGGRSERVTRFLNANGFPQAVNLAGGIDAYAQEIEPQLARY
ncbi:MAG: rhodanese-like domain-containing protein [Candidatus Velthaea sp.]|jgi:rhodanese-related sulfurtransferase